MLRITAYLLGEGLPPRTAHATPMKHALLLLLALAAPAHSAPVHVSLHATAAGPSAGGFLTLAQIADLSGGTKAERARMAAVPVGRSPLPGETRLLTWGDVSLKLRQAGLHPERDAVLEGAKQVAVAGTETAPPAVLPAPAPSESAPFQAAAPSAARAIAIHRSDAITIVVRQGDLLVTAKGVAREPGSVGQIIRVHRDGAPSDLAATVLDAQTVQLEP